MTLREAAAQLREALAPPALGPELGYDAREREAIARQAARSLVGREAFSAMWATNAPLSPEQTSTWQGWQRSLASGQPLQYVTGRADFLGLELEVTPAVLIPRPETEELVIWALECLRGIERSTLLDMGTGSGCIALALKHARPDATVIGADLSHAALDVAGRNSARLGLSVNWLLCDLLTAGPRTFERLQLIVSNPPYVPPSEAPTLAAHVRDHEPHLALFTPTDDALVHYRRLAELGPHWLAPGGQLLVELHSPMAEATRALFAPPAWAQVELRADLQGRPRMLRARRG